MTRIDVSRKTLTSLPNILTYARMAMIPAIIALLIPPVSSLAKNTAFALFVVASITDYLDGILARRYDLVTAFGKLLDPLADKLLTTAVLIMLIPLNKVQAWLVVLIIGRELGITGVRSIAAGQGFILGASRMGKNKMISQTIALILLLIDIPQFQGILDTAGTVFLWISVVLGYWSAIDYLTFFFGDVKHQKQDAEKRGTA